jgi:hypothetical protein
MGPIGCPETSVQNYHPKLHNIPEERRSHLHRGGSLKSRTRRACLLASKFYSSYIRDHSIVTLCYIVTLHVCRQVQRLSIAFPTYRVFPSCLPGLFKNAVNGTDSITRNGNNSAGSRCSDNPLISSSD